jgi:hypothetical protein
MLISMPTCTSTIFGVFQVIRVLLGQRHDCRGKIEATSQATSDEIHFDQLLLKMAGRRTRINR